MISCIVPSYNSEDYISGTLVSILRNSNGIEVIVTDNGSTDNTVNYAMQLPVKIVTCNILGRSIGENKNYGAKYAKGDILVFTDSDNKISRGFFKEIKKLSKDPINAGGGCKYIYPTRKSLGIFLYMLCVYPKCKINHTGIGAFWVRRWVFEDIKGFSTDKNVLDDIDFAMRLKRFCDITKMKYKNLESPLYWSTRKFDEKGDWHWVKHLWSFFKAVYTTKCNKKLQDDWYEFSRNLP